MGFPHDSDGKASAFNVEVRSLGREDPLEKEMATHSSILAWIIPWIEDLGKLQSTGLQKVRHDWVTSLRFTYNDRYLLGRSNCPVFVLQKPLSKP